MLEIGEDMDEAFNYGDDDWAEKGKHLFDILTTLMDDDEAPIKENIGVISDNIENVQNIEIAR